MEKYTDKKTFWWLIAILAVLAAIGSYLPYGAYGPQLSPQQLAIPKYQIALANAGMVLVIYSLLGWLGLKLSQRLGFAKMWEERVTNKQRFLYPACIGIATGLLFIITDQIFSRFNQIGHFPHPPFPVSIVASLTAGIGEEVMFRLFFIPFWVWLISWAVFRKRWQNPIFWIVAVFSAVTFALGHLPAVFMLFGWTNISQVPPALLWEIILLNGVVSMFAAYYFRKWGFLAAVGIHFWTDFVWHVIWGVIK